MQVRYHKSFQKQFLKLQPAQKKRLKMALTVFMAKPNNPKLYNHPLIGQWQGHYSIAFGGDWRAHYKIVDDTAIFVAVGTHSQLYR